MAITALPTPPLRSDPTNFAARGDAFLAALPTFVAEANATALAMNLNATNDTSASSVAIGTGTKTFAVSAGMSFQPGMYLVIADAAAPSTNSMFGQVTSYSGTALVMNVISVTGSGTKTAWVISMTAPGGAKAGANTDITSLGAVTGVTATAGDSSAKLATTAFVANNSVPVGTIIDVARTTAPTGFLVCPTAQTNVSRATYAALFAAIGTTWGAGDGSTTFGLPWFAADYAALQANANVGTSTAGAVIAHTHTYASSYSATAFQSGGNSIPAHTTASSVATGSTGGSANLAAGVRVLKCIKY